MHNQPRVFLYFDRDGIESLFAQTVDRVEIEIRKSTEQGLTKKGGAKLGLGKAIAALLGVEVGADLESSKANTQLEETKSGLTVEHKLARLREYLSHSNNLADDLNAAIARDSEVDASVFIDISESFDLPQFVKGGVTQANREGAILFQIDQRANSAKVVMVASLTKFPSAANGRLNRLSHVALHFSSFSGRDMPLHVFGHIRSLGTGTFQIKPYAIW